MLQKEADGAGDPRTLACPVHCQSRYSRIRPNWVVSPLLSTSGPGQLTNTNKHSNPPDPKIPASMKCTPGPGRLGWCPVHCSRARSVPRMLHQPPVYTIPAPGQGPQLGSQYLWSTTTLHDVPGTCRPMASDMVSASGHLPAYSSRASASCPVPTLHLPCLPQCCSRANSGVVFLHMCTLLPTTLTSG